MKTQLVPFFTEVLARISLGVVASVGVVSCLLPQPSLAQQSSDLASPSADFQHRDNLDPFSSKTDTSGFSVLNLINRLQLGNSQSLEDFNSEQSQNFDDAAAKFRNQQLQRIHNQTSPAQPVKNTQ
ncbi:MAG: hypothetical protein NVS2B14_10450 [Chamaesiphon sp.]